MNKPRVNQTAMYNFERDGKFYVTYSPANMTSFNRACAYCWTDNATVPVPYPQLSSSIVGKYANGSWRYATGIYRFYVNQTKWYTYDG